MTRKADLPHAEIIKMWDDGLSAKHIAKLYGVSHTPIERILKLHDRGGQRLVCPNEDVVALHLEEGMSVKAIATKLGISRPVVNRILRDQGVKHRNRSEAMFERMRQSTPDVRRSLAEKAHNANRGRKKTIEEQEAFARSKYNNQKLSSIEQVFLQAFMSCGIDVEPQFPIGKWNCDFAIVERKIDIEIDPGHWHSSPIKQRSDPVRDAEIKSKGWIVIRWHGKNIRRSNVNLLDHAITLIRSQLSGIVNA